MDLQQYFNQPQSRRKTLRQLSMLAGVSLVLDGCTNPFEKQPPVPTVHPAPNSINHVLIACQENRTFDTYFGYYPGAGKFGIPQNYFQPDGKGGKVTPHHLTAHRTQDISHSWQSIHLEWDNGRMDGFFIADGLDALGYYNGSDLPYYYALANSFTLCGNYFCYQLGPTLPNRIALWAGTSGGITTGSRIPTASLDWPTIVDLLDAHKVSWKCYNLGTGLGSYPEIEFFNALPFFKRWHKDRRLYYLEKDYYNDLKAGSLPQVSFLISDAFTSEHPLLNIQAGQSKMAQVINALIASRLWQSSVLFLTYDEGGGYFDHVVPKRVDAYGMGMRVPTFVISPYAKRGYISGQLYEHNSLLKFIERRFSLPTLASVNHHFDTMTPALYNDAALGKQYGPPAPPRDGLAEIGDFYEALDLTQNPKYYPSLPKV